MYVDVLYCSCILSFGYLFSLPLLQVILIILLEFNHLFFLITQLDDLYAGNIYLKQIKDITVTDR